MEALAIDIQKLTKRYGDLTALGGVDLEVRKGEFFGLLGPNGAGKTTTINIMSGLCNKSSGEVHLFGYELIKQYRDCRRMVGLVPQEFNFDQFTRLKKMLMFQGGYFGIPKAICDKRSDELLERFDLKDKWDTPARFLSGGMKRRLIIARALMHEPQLLILDEPTAGVDVDLRKSLWQFLTEINEKGTTILLTTHYIEEAEALCDNIAIINRGQIIARDSTRNMTERLTRESLLVTGEQRIGSEVLEKLKDYAPSLSEDEHELTLTFDKGAYHEALEQIVTSGLRVSNIKPVDNRLERVFLELTKEDGPNVGA
ncbi:MAG: ABC transporter ATP-binding protein [Verrucomicrobiota bacterium]